jgi:RNA polymerase sigma factor (sigma-70 family)
MGAERLMAANPMSGITHYLHKLALRDGGEIADGELLSAFVHRRDHAALAALVKRHGPMVWGVCRRLLRSHHDAEDAFQATFVVLVRKAASVRDRAAVANWLYGVAYQTAVRVRAAVAKRQRREGHVKEMPEPMAREASLWDDLQSLLDLELSRLPDKYRALIVLCDLEGKTRKQVARQLGCPEGTVAGRLARARALLARRLARHGLAVAGGALAGLFGHGTASAGVPASVLACAIHATSLSASGGPAAEAISARVAALSEGVLKTMLLTKLKIGTFLALVVALLAMSGILEGSGAAKPVAAGPAAKRPARAEPGAPKGNPGKKGNPKPTVLKAERPIYRLAWNPDGKVIAAASLAYDAKAKGFKSTVQVWDVAKGDVRISLGEEDKVRVESIAFSPDGKRIALAARSAGRPAEVRLLDAEKGLLQKTIELRGTVRTVTFAPDSKTLAIGGQDIPQSLTGPFPRTVLLWDVAKGKEVKEFKEKLKVDDITKSGQLDGLRDLAYSPDGKLLAAADVDFRVRLIDVQTGRVQQTLAGHTELVLALAFSPDGKTLVSGGADETVRVWDVQTGKGLRTLEGTVGQVWAVAFSPDGKYLVTGGAILAEGKKRSGIILWDAQSGKPRRVLPGDRIGVSAVAFSPDGNVLAVGGGAQQNTGAIQLWRVKELLSDTQ